MSGAPIIPLMEQDFDVENMLDQFPEDFECPSCMMIMPELLECRSCHQFCCKDCLANFSKMPGKNVPNGKYECTVCHQIDSFNKQNRILQDILMNLRFQCTSKCKEIYPYSELLTHV